MTGFTLNVHVTGSARAMADDLPYLRTIIQTVYANQANVVRNWIEPAYSRNKHGIPGEAADWTSILKENIEAVKRSDLVIVETTQSRFSQGYQTYIAMQYKKPTLLVTRSQVKNRFISGVGNKYITIKEYKNDEELAGLVTRFIKSNTIPAKDLRFNMVLDRRIYRHLRDKSYETGKNKSEIIRDLLEREINRRNP